MIVFEKFAMTKEKTGDGGWGLGAGFVLENSVADLSQ